MPEKVTNTCSRCGKEQGEWPALAYESPDNYNILSEEDKQSIAKLDANFCIVRHADQTDRFIRCTLTQKITDHCEVLEYGLWVSLSEKSYQDYSDNFRNENHEAKYFGWLCNDLPEYEICESIPTTVFTRSGALRPEIIPHENLEHPFVHDYYNGITKKQAEKRIRDMLLYQANSNVD